MIARSNGFGGAESTHLEQLSSRGLSWLRMRVPCAGMSPVLDEAGIIVTRAEGLSGPVYLVIDEQEENTGASATNAMTQVVALVARQLKAGSWQRALWVCRDSEAAFDWVVPTWSDDLCVGVRWAPLGWPGKALRSEAAFLGCLGRTARTMLELANGLSAGQSG